MKRNFDILKAFKREISLNTKIVKSKKAYNRKKLKQQTRKNKSYE